MASAEKKRVAVIMPARCGLAESKRQDWVIDAELGHTVDDIQDPAYWGHIAASMSPLDHIEVRAEDGSWLANLIVRYCERNYAKVHLVDVINLDINTDAPASSIKHKVEWKGPHNKFCVIRVSDAQLLHSGCKTREEASSWLKSHEKGLEG